MREKFDQARKDEFLKLLAKGVSRSNACKKVGIHRSTFNAHYKKYPRFREQVLQAEMDANELVEQALFKAALDGNVTAQQVWLYNRCPDRWRDRRNIQWSGDQNNPVRIKLRWIDSDDNCRVTTTPPTAEDGSGG